MQVDKVYKPPTIEVLMLVCELCVILIHTQLAIKAMYLLESGLRVGLVALLQILGS